MKQKINVFKIDSLFILLLTLLFGCKNNAPLLDSKLHYLDVDNAKEVTIDALDIIKEIEYIPIMEQKDMYINDIKRIRQNKDYFFLKSVDQSYIFAVSKQGELKFKIDDIGQGPYQYSNLTDFTIDENNFLYLTERENQKILKFDIDKRKVVDEWQFKSTNARSVKSFKNNLYFITVDRDNGFFYEVKNEDFDNIRKFVKKPSSFNLAASIKPIGTTKDTIFFNVGFTDTIYYSVGDGILPYAVTLNSFGDLTEEENKMFRQNIIDRNFTEKQKRLNVQFGKLTIIDNYWIMAMFQPQGMLVWNRNNNKQFFAEPKIDNYKLIANWNFLDILDTDDSGYCYSDIMLDDNFYKTAEKAMKSNNIAVKNALQKLLEKYPQGSGYENPVIVKWKFNFDKFK